MKTFATLYMFLISGYALLGQHQNISKSTITSVGSSSIHLNQKYIVSQSIGQTGIVGTTSHKGVSLQQGFLSNTITFSIDNNSGNSVKETFSFVISPNPFIENIKVDFSKKTKEDIHIIIYDINGKVHKKASFNPQSEVSIPLSNLSTGDYLIQVNSGNTTATKKIIKTNRTN